VLPWEAAEVTALTWEDVAWVTDDVAWPTKPRIPVEPVGAEPPGPPEAAGAEGDDDGVVSAWAWREKSTKMARIPAASSAACIARRAT
jgi:hypothetical protein